MRNAALGPSATATGRLYQRAFYTLEGRSSRRAALILTGMVLLIVKLPIVVAIFTLMLLDGVVYIGLGKPCLARVSSTKV